MATYKNDYNKNDDYMMWELHEIRHKLSQKFKKMTVKEINEEGKSIYHKWKKERNKVAKAV